MHIRCPECGFTREVSEGKIPPTAKMATCPKCGQKFPFRQDPGEEAESSVSENDHAEGPNDHENDIWSQLESMSEDEQPGQRPGRSAEFTAYSRVSGSQIPWENLKDVGFFPGLMETIKGVMFHPRIFFEGLPLGQGYNKPLIFYLLIAEIQALAQFIWRMAGIAPQVGQGNHDFLGLGLAGMSSLLVLILYPVFLAGMLFVISALNHACLLAVKAGARGYEATFKVISYANAPMVLAVLPLFGPMAGMVWTMVCTFLGFKYVHQTTNMRVLMAMLLPLVVVILISSLVVSVRGMG